MKNKITKIQQLDHVESFLQILFVKGYKYIDKAGEIVNYFYKDHQEPKFSMDLSKLDIFEPDHKINSIKISAQTFWAHFDKPDSLEQIDSYFGSKAHDVIKILEVEQINQIGWRNYFVYKFNTSEDRKKVLSKFNPITDIEFSDITLTTTIQKVNLIIKLRKVVETSSEQPAILIDIDLYQKYEELIGINLINPTLTKFKEIIRSDIFLGKINDILS
jgi:hypothetical protein